MEFSVYLKVDDAGRVIDINSSMFLKDTAGWVEIARGCGDAFQHAQGNFMPKPIYNMGVPMFKMENGEVKERSAEEINSDIKQAKSEIEKKQIDALKRNVPSLMARLDHLEKFMKLVEKHFNME